MASSPGNSDLGPAGDGVAKPAPAADPSVQPTFKFRKSSSPLRGPLPPLPAHQPSAPAAAVSSVAETPSWSPLAVALPLFAVMWIVFAALAATVTSPSEADVATLGHLLVTGVGIVSLVLVTLAVAHTQVSGRRPRPAAVAVVVLGLTQGAVAAAIGSGPSDLWRPGALMFVLVGVAIPLAWVGGQFQIGVRRQRAERRDSLVASWIERARHQAHETVESLHRHDIRSMLFAVEGVARTLADPRLPEDQRAPFLQMLSESLDRLGKLADARTEEIQAYDVGGVVRAVVHAERKGGRTINAEMPAGLLAVGRATDVAAVLRTFVGLADRHRPGGLQVSGELNGEARVIRIEPAGARPLPLLTENWEEISPETFNPASTGDDTSIDLYVAARLLAEQGADVWSTSRGDRFAVRLPAAPDSTAEEET